MTDLTATGKRRGFADACCARRTAVRASVFLGLLVALGSVATCGPAKAQEFDGVWSGTFSCKDYKSYKAYSIPVEANITDDVLKLDIAYLSGGESLSGRIVNGSVELVGQGHDPNGQWQTKLRGKFFGPLSLTADGVKTAGNGLSTVGRPCHLTLSRRKEPTQQALGPVLEIPPSVAAQVKSSPRLTGAEVRSLVFGNTMTGEEPGTARWSMYIAPSGEARISGALLSNSNHFSDAGQITVRNNRFCATWQRIRNGAERCTAIVRYGNFYVGLDDEGTIVTSFVVRSGDPDNLFPSVSQAVEAERRNSESAIAEAKKKTEQEQQTAAKDENEAAQEKQDAVAALEKASRAQKATEKPRKQAKELGEANRPAAIQNFVFGNILVLLPKTEDARQWEPMERYIPLTEIQFCHAIEKFRPDLEAAAATRNEIKQYAKYKDRQEDLASLLPNGEFENWLVHASEVTVAEDGSAAVVLQLPCRGFIGSNPCGADAKSYHGVPEGSPLYREIAKFDTGDWVVVSGVLVGVSEPKLGPLPSYRFFPAGTYCEKLEAGKSQDLFEVQLRYIFKVR